MTLKQLHEQVGRLPMRVRLTSNEAIVYTVEAKLSNGDFAATRDDSASDILYDTASDWQLVPEKKKALAYSKDAGNIFFVLENSKEHEFIKTSTAFTRQECFDIESGE